MNKGRLFIVEIYSCDCPECGDCFETGISKGDAEFGQIIRCENCGAEIEVEEIED